MRTFSVKNFERFQHYKDRAPPWIKLYNELLDDYEFGRLQDASKMHLIAIWLLASRSDNKIPYDPEWVARRINATEKVDLDALSRAGFIVTDQPLQGEEHVASIVPAKRLPRGEGETEAEGEKSSDPNGSAPNGAADPIKALFDFGRKVMTDAGKSDHQARSLLGGWRKDTKDDAWLMATLVQVKRDNIQDPVAYIEAAITRRSKPGGLYGGAML